MLNLSSKRATRIGDILEEVLKANIDTYLKNLIVLESVCLKNGVFPDEPNLEDLSPVFKNDESIGDENYRPVSILFNMSKVFEGIFYKQTNNFMTLKFSPFPYGFRKNKYSLLKMMEI